MSPPGVTNAQGSAPTGQDPAGPSAVTATGITRRGAADGERRRTGPHHPSGAGKSTPLHLPAGLDRPPRVRSRSAGGRWRGCGTASRRQSLFYPARLRVDRGSVHGCDRHRIQHAGVHESLSFRLTPPRAYALAFTGRWSRRSRPRAVTCDRAGTVLESV